VRAGRRTGVGVGRAGREGYKRQPVNGKKLYKLGMMLRGKKERGKAVEE
jgi:hypothetical protein